MKSEVRLTLMISALCWLCLLISGCCVVEVKHGREGESLKLASTKNAFPLLRGESLKVVVARKSGFCRKPLNIEKSQWSESKLMSVVGEANTYEYIFEAKDINESFQYWIPNVARGGGPFQVVDISDDEEDSERTAQYLYGRELGLKHEKRQLRTYRLLIALFKEYPITSKSCEHDRDEFLKGFRAAYDEMNADVGLAREIEDLLRKTLSLEDSIYRDMMQRGGLYEKNKISHSEIAKLIHRNSRTPEYELACKAGFIEGYVRAHSNPDKKSLYQDALWVYITFKASARF